MYARPIKVYQGIDNPLQIVVKNQDQKPVNLTGYSLQVDIQDSTNQITAYSFAANMAAPTGNVLAGIATFTLTSGVVNSLDQRYYKLTTRIIKTSDSTQTPLYTDDNFSVPLDLEVMPAYYSTSANIVTNIGETIIDPGLLP